MGLQTMTREQITAALHPPELTDRQRQLLAAIAAGHTIDAAARSCYVSRSTARQDLNEVRTRLGARNLAHAVALAYEASILPAGGR